MIEVRTDIVPFGIEEARHTIGMLWIINVKGGNGEVADYEWRLVADGTTYVGKIEGYRRKENDSFTLIKLALEQLDEQRKGG